MRISLRLRLFTLVTVAVALAAIPAGMHAYRTLGEAALDFERRNFDSMVLMVQDRLKTSYMTLLSRETEEVMRHKFMLRNMARISSEIWRDLRPDSPPEERNEVVQKLQAVLADHKVYSEIYDAKTGFLLADSMFGALGANLKRTDFKGDTFAELLAYDRLPEDGAFAVFRLNGPRGKPWPQLIYCMPHPDTQLVLCLGVPLEEISERIGQRYSLLLKDVRSQLNTVDMHGMGEISIINAERRRLASTRETFAYEEDCIPDAVFEEAERGGLAEYMEPAHNASHGHEAHDNDFDGAYYRVAYFNTLDWYMVAVIPHALVEAPAAALARRIGLMALVTAVLSLLGTLLVTSRLTTPLRTLTAKALELARRDFSSAGNFAAKPLFADRREERALLGRSDEVGQLAGAFAHMDKALRENIAHLVDLTAVRERLQGELTAARDIQRGILPPPAAIPVAAGCTVSALLEPAREVGGDLYDAFPLRDGRQAVAMGDVSGKGVPAALFMAMTVMLVRHTLDEGLSLELAMERINDRLAANNPENMFVTLFIGLFDPATGRLDFVNAGHCLPLLVKEGRVRELNVVSGPAVGSFPDMHYTASSTVLAPGEYGFLYSDGVSEAMNEQNVLFGEGRLCAALETLPREAVLSGLLDRLTDWRGAAEQSDDIAMLLFGCE